MRSKLRYLREVSVFGVAPANQADLSTNTYTCAPVRLKWLQHQDVARYYILGISNATCAERGTCPTTAAEPCESASKQGKHKGKGGTRVRVGASTPQEWEQPRLRMHNGERSGRRRGGIGWGRLHQGRTPVSRCHDVGEHVGLHRVVGGVSGVPNGDDPLEEAANGPVAVVAPNSQQDGALLPHGLVPGGTGTVVQRGQGPLGRVPRLHGAIGASAAWKNWDEVTFIVKSRDSMGLTIPFVCKVRCVQREYKCECEGEFECGCGMWGVWVHPAAHLRSRNQYRT
jgi:hypothetical protein